MSKQVLQSQQVTHKIPVLHWAYIEGQNDSVADTEAICMAIGELDLRIDINIVRYNPFDARFGLESDISVIERNMALLRESLPGSDVHTIERVGFDVAASCGMFVK